MAPNETTSSQNRVDLKEMLPDELRAFVTELGEKEYRATQILGWVQKGLDHPAKMSNLPLQFRKQLEEVATISRLTEVRKDESSGNQATKFLFELPGGDRVESVLIRAGKRRTVCLSSQVGCALDCTFCATGQMGFVRNLSAAQIVDQALQIGRYLGEHNERISNVVMMGMGEPLLNLDNVVRAVRLMALEDGLAIGGRKVTVSTAGYLPGIQKLTHAGVNVRLALSLNATTDEQRQQLMPINRKYPIGELLKAVQEFHQLRGGRITFEYVLMEGINDADDDAHRLAALSRPFTCKINLIPYNELGTRSPYRRPSRTRVMRFQQLLEKQGRAAVTVRESRGRDINAACGQLFQETNTRRAQARKSMTDLDDVLPTNRDHY